LCNDKNKHIMTSLTDLQNQIKFQEDLASKYKTETKENLKSDMNSDKIFEIQNKGLVADAIAGVLRQALVEVTKIQNW